MGLLGALAIAAPIVVRFPATAGVIAAAPAPAVADSARARASTGDVAGAAADVRMYLAAHPGDPQAGRALGDLVFRMGDTRAAEAAWLHVLALDPNDGAVHLRLGALYASQRRTAAAIEHYDAVVPTPASVTALVRLHARAGDLDRYLAIAADEAARHHFDADLAWREANLLQVTRHEREALEWYSRVIGLRGERCDDLIGRAGDFLALHRIDDAIADVRRCLQKEPSSYDALVAMGTSEIARNAPEAARPWIDRALDVDPTGIDALIDRAVIEDAGGAPQLAMRDNRAALALDPTRPEAYANIAFDQLERRLVAAAETTIADGLHADPTNGRLHYLLAQAYRMDQRPVASVRAEYLAALGSDEDVVVQAANDALRSLSITH